MWLNPTIMAKFLLDPQCWIDHMKLDAETGLDPPGIKLRAAEGLHAADYVLPGYWVWGRVIENLGLVGYDSNNMKFEAYDWRLAHPDLERRDHYFSRLKVYHGRFLLK